MNKTGMVLLKKGGLQVFSEQIASKLELAAKRALNLKKKKDMAGIISSKFIIEEKGAYTVLTAALSPYYLNAMEEERIPLDQLLEKYRYLQNCSHEDYFKGVDWASEDISRLMDKLGIYPLEE